MLEKLLRSRCGFSPPLPGWRGIICKCTGLFQLLCFFFLKKNYIRHIFNHICFMHQACAVGFAVVLFLVTAGLPWVSQHQKEALHGARVESVPPVFSPLLKEMRYLKEFFTVQINLLWVHLKPWLKRSLFFSKKPPSLFDFAIECLHLLNIRGNANASHPRSRYLARVCVPPTV